MRLWKQWTDECHERTRKSGPSFPISGIHHHNLPDTQMYTSHSGTTAERQKLRNKHRRERSEVLADRRIFKTLPFIADEDAFQQLPTKKF
ncbi:hypothetical protein CEXT_160031 [Caerostris extrusa]|uniref:Uncharacterized protein n=1 Tax=Caerostris extrusa TaxID=172846 RepID=A0AAV4NEZ7_CAEEX|nr:hypothetical protein CEXT_160031 [Caerostris extrusa]